MCKLHWGTAHLAEEEFVQAFENCSLPNEMFHHADHIRLAWTYLRRFGESVAAERMAQSIARYAAHHGATQKFHITITAAWMRLLTAALRTTPEIARFETFADAHPLLFDQGTLKKYYSAELLKSPQARTSWLEPDLCALP